MVSQNLVNIGSGNGLVMQGNKPLPEPMLTYQYGSIIFIGMHFETNLSHQQLNLDWNWYKMSFKYPRSNEETHSALL